MRVSFSPFLFQKPVVSLSFWYSDRIKHNFYQHEDSGAGSKTKRCVVSQQTLSIWALCCNAQSVWQLWHTWSLALSKRCHVCHQCCDNGREKLTTPLNPQGQRNHSQSINPLILHVKWDLKHQSKWFLWGGGGTKFYEILEKISIYKIIYY